MATTQQTPLRRKDRSVQPQDALAWAAQSDYCVLSTCDSEGVPYGVPISPVLEKNHFYFHCATTGRKLENLQQQAQVCMTFVAKMQIDGAAFTTRYESVIAEGKASLVTEEAEKRHALQLLCMRYTTHTTEEIAQYITKYFAQTMVVKVEMTHICGKSNPLQN